MVESNDGKELQMFFTEVQESHIKIIFSSKCIKAQAFLINKLKKQVKTQKEICNIISSENIKLEAEIKFAELEVKNLIIAHDTIKSGNIELRKEWLLKKAEKLEITTRIDVGVKKYEELWLSSKNRYESIPFVQKYLQAKNRSHLIESNINNLQNEYVRLLNDIKIKKYALIKLDQKRIIDLANFMISGRPKIISMIHDKMNEINELTIEFNILEKKEFKKSPTKLRTTMEVQQTAYTEKILQDKERHDNWPCLFKNENDAIVMPKLQFLDLDLDVPSVKLDQIKKVDLNTEQRKATVIDEVKNRKPGNEINDPAHFNIIGLLNQEKRDKNYSGRKLIHILDDVKLEKTHVANIISMLDHNQFQMVNFIRSEETEEPMEICDKSENTVTQPLEKEDVEENDNSFQKIEVLVPPTQFLDEKKNSQVKKKKSLDVSMEISSSEFIEANNNQSDINVEEGNGNETITSQDVTLVSDDDYVKMKDKILTKHKLDVSPQFVYAKHSILHKMTEDNIVTSKFFDPKSSRDSETIMISDKKPIDVKNGNDLNKDDRAVPQPENNKSKNPADLNMDNNKIEMSNSKNNQDNRNIDLPVMGFLFHHGSQGISNSLNLSESTTGFEDDEDYPHCIDSSVLLSPKADVPMEVANNNVQVPSQEVSNFISGPRKPGTSFFGWPSSSSKSNSDVQNAQGNFNFNFSGEEKKTRGGLFSMFR